MAIAISHREDKRTGIIVTVVFHVLLLLLFMFIGLTQPDPLPEESGIELAMADYGTTDYGSGDAESEDPSDQETEDAASASAPSESAPEEVATQDDESVVSAPEVTDPAPTSKPETSKPKEPAKPTVSTSLKDALSTNWGNSGGNSGDGDDDQQGNSGINTGDPTGVGTFHGDGWSVSLGGRGVLRGPKFTDKPKENGTVVLNIFVDRNGVVKRTTVNLSKSTTTSQALINMAQKAAKDCKFAAKPDAAAEQRGEMKFKFVLQ
jgi:outer membrane biosynthesis protein TonB